MINNKIRVNQCGQIRGRRSGARTTQRRTRRGRVGCARPASGDRRLGRGRTWTLALFFSVSLLSAASDTAYLESLARLFVRGLV